MRPYAETAPQSSWNDEPTGMLSRRDCGYSAAMAQNLNNASVLLAFTTVLSFVVLMFLIFLASGSGAPVAMGSIALFGAASAIGLGISARTSES